MGTRRRAVVVAHVAHAVRGAKRRPWLWVDGKWSRPVGVSISMGSVTVPSDRGWLETWPNPDACELSVQEVPDGPWWDVLSSATMTKERRGDVVVWELRRR